MGTCFTWPGNERACGPLESGLTSYPQLFSGTHFCLFSLFWWLPHQKWSSPKRVPFVSRVTEQLSTPNKKAFGVAGWGGKVWKRLPPLVLRFRLQFLWPKVELTQSVAPTLGDSAKFDHCFLTLWRCRFGSGAVEPSSYGFAGRRRKGTIVEREDPHDSTVGIKDTAG